MSWLSQIKNEILAELKLVETSGVPFAVSNAASSVTQGVESLTAALDQAAANAVESAITTIGGPAVATLTAPIVEAIQVYCTKKLQQLEAEAAAKITGQ
jgi:hypothetical protein